MKLQKPLYPCLETPIYKNDYKKPIVSQFFGENLNATYVNDYHMAGHNGIDIPCQEGTPVFAAHDGKVIGIQDKLTYGYGVKLQSDDGAFNTIYWHLKGFNCHVGDKVKALDLIGFADSTGNSTGNHLHFGYYPLPGNPDNGYQGAEDPMPFIETPKFQFNNNLFMWLKNDDVRNLQIALANEGFLGGVDFPGFTGFYGTMTFKAVQAFQRKYGILTTGFCGPITRSKLNETYA